MRPPLTTSVARRDAIVSAAAAEFAVHGLHGVATSRIAERAGISHAYRFRFVSEGMPRAAGLTVVDVHLEDQSPCSGA